MSENNILDNITLDDLEGDQRALAEIIGIEDYRQLVKEYGGTHIYIPEHEGFKAAARNALIRKEFNGYNFKDLARKYDLTESSIRNIVGDLKNKIRSAPLEGQQSFF